MQRLYGKNLIQSGIEREIHIGKLMQQHSFLRGNTTLQLTTLDKCEESKNIDLVEEDLKSMFPPEKSRILPLINET